MLKKEKGHTIHLDQDQTKHQSWGLDRLASALTAGKAAAIDYDIIQKGCDHKKTAFILANKSRK